MQLNCFADSIENVSKYEKLDQTYTNIYVVVIRHRFVVFDRGTSHDTFFVELKIVLL